MDIFVYISAFVVCERVRMMSDIIEKYAILIAHSNAWNHFPFTIYNAHKYQNIRS